MTQQRGQRTYMTEENKSKIKIQYKTVSELEPYDKNARNHSLSQIKQIADSIKEFGFTNPILIDGDRGVIAGHGRLYAARLLEMPKVPCIELSHLTEDQKRAYVIADNQLALNADWDFDILQKEIDQLKDADFDVSITGINFDELGNVRISEEGESGSDKQSGSSKGDDSSLKVIVICEDEADQQTVMKIIRARGYECREG